MDENENYKNNKDYKNYFKIIGIFLAGFVIGALMVSQSINDSVKDMKILYVSQDEIIDLEKERLQSLGNKENVQLFFGQPDHAIGLIELFATEYENEANGNIVVFSRGSVSGNKVKSISKGLHKKVIKELDAMIVGK